MNAYDALNAWLAKHPMLVAAFLAAFGLGCLSTGGLLSLWGLVAFAAAAVYAREALRA